MPATSIATLKRELDRLLEDLEVDLDANADSASMVEAAVARFKSRGPAILESATGALWAYYESEVAEMEIVDSAKFRLPDGIEHSEIWGYVSVINPPTVVQGNRPLSPAQVYFSFEGEVPWEPEHGLSLVVEDGQRIGKLGPFDGHVSNARAYNDVSLLGVMFVDPRRPNLE